MRKSDPTWRADQIWHPGDQINLSIGQGDLQITPLQLAVAYAAIANGGTIVTPHVVQDVERPGRTPITFAHPTHPVPGLDPGVLAAIRQGLDGVTHDVDGTAYQVFGNFAVNVAGKTGTAQVFAPDGHELPSTRAVRLVRSRGQPEDRRRRDHQRRRPRRLRRGTRGDALLRRLLRRRDPQDRRRERPLELMSSLYLPNEAIRTRAELKKAAQPSLATYLRRVDWLLYAAVLGLALLSLETIAAGTKDDLAGNPTYYVDAQRLNFIVGGVGMLVATFINPSLYRRLAWPLAAVTVAMLCLVLVAGDEVRGARRWITVGSFNFQPSDVGKLVLVIGVAALLANHREQIGRWWLTPLALLYAGAAAALVYVEPDLGTSLVFFAATLGVLFVAGTPWTHFAALVCVVAAGAFLVLSVLPASGVQVVKGYQMDRLTQFLHPEKNLDSTGWNLYQAKIAVGSGGLDGRATRHAVTPTGRPAQDFLPEHHTDFVFASLGEHKGFLGSALLLALYLVLAVAHPQGDDRRGDPVREPGLRRDRDLVPVLDLHQHRDDHRARARDRHPVAVHVVRRLGDPRRAVRRWNRAGSAAARPDAGARCRRASRYRYVTSSARCAPPRRRGRRAGSG